MYVSFNGVGLGGRKGLCAKKLKEAASNILVPNAFGNFDTASYILHEAKPRVISEVSRQYLDGRQARSPDRSQS